jgi:drug/metabolite transporter (DMT)-like permease
MRAGASEFGPVALAAVRVGGASAFLLPLLLVRREAGQAWRRWPALVVVGLTNSALPFLCFTYAALTLPAGVMSVFNASTPLMGAVIAWLWLSDAMTRQRAVGLAIGFLGVLWLVWSRSGPAAASGLDLQALGPVLACLAATLCYGFAASFTKRYLSDVPPVAVAAGSQFSATLMLAVPAYLWWPSVQPSAHAWGAALLLAVLCTGVAYVVFFHLIGQIGPANTISVTFMIPLFAALWGWVFLDEAVSFDMVLGCATILFGTALTTGLLRWPQRWRAAPEAGG